MKRRTLIALLVAGVCAAPAAAAPIPGLDDDHIVNLTDPVAIAARADTAAATGARWMRVDLDWSIAAPTRPADASNPDDPAYAWGRYDAIISAYRDRGLGVLIDVLGTPPWASSSGKWNAAPSAVDGGTFAAVVAQRYNGTWPKPGGGVLPAIKAISPRNEPDIDQFTTPQCRRVGSRWVPVAPKNYAQLMKAAYPRIKAVHPTVLVLGGDTGTAGDKSCSSANTPIGTLNFIRAVHKELGNTRKVPFDAWAQHVHPVGPPTKAAFFPSWKTLPQLTKVINKMHPKNRMPLLITETGYATTYTAFHRYFVSEAQQASYLTQTYQLAAKIPQIELVIWFNLQDHSAWSAGLYREDGSEKPSLATFRQSVLTYPVGGKWVP